MIDLELSNGSKPAFPAHKISMGDIVGVDEYKKDKQTKSVIGSNYSGVVLRASDTKITVALGHEIELPQEVQERCMM